MIALLDWDGLVADTMPHLYKFITKVMGMWYLQPKFTDFNDFRENHWSEPYSDFYEKVGFDWDHDKDELYRLYTDYMSKAKPEMFPGMDKVFFGLRAAKIPTAIVSSSATNIIEEDARRYGVRDCIDVIVGVDSLPSSKKMKPHPASLLIAQHRMQDHDAVYAGDMCSDFEAAQRVAEFRKYPVPFIMASYGFTPKNIMPKLEDGLLAIVDKPVDLLDEILLHRSLSYASRN